VRPRPVEPLLTHLRHRRVRNRRRMLLEHSARIGLDQSGFAPENLTTLPHFWVSADLREGIERRARA
jgi:hypothetical protein